METISVAIPAHNEEQSIYRTLNSVVKSSIKKYGLEIVVCLSFCSDGTLDEIHRFTNDNPTVHIKTIEEHHGGKSRAMKLLDDSILNNIIIFVDADCSPDSDAICMLYEDLKSSPQNIKLVSGNAIDPRFTNLSVKPLNIIQTFNHVFWQRSPRNVVNGQLLSARKGVVQVLPDDIKLDDVYLSIYYWNEFKKNNDAIQIQGSPSTLYEIIRYQKNIQSGKKQIQNYLAKQVKDFDQISRKHYSQFYILLTDRNKYYPNISFIQLVLVKIIMNLAKLWGIISAPSWVQTKGSKAIVQN